LEAIRRGIGFFVEKPIALSVGKAARVGRELAKSPVVNAVGYMNRYRDSVVAARREIGKFGFLGMTAQWVNSAYGVPWWRQTDQSGGSLNEQATHFVDLVRYLGGDIAEVFAFGTHDVTTPQLVTSASIALRLATGQVATLFYSCVAKYKSIHLRVQLEDREMAWSGWELLADGQNEMVGADRNAIFLTETGAFLQAASGGPNRILSTFEDAIRSQAAVDAIIRSLATGKPEDVNIPDLAEFAGSD
jgi:predicted dehydrogenase